MEMISEYLRRHGKDKIQFSNYNLPKMFKHEKAKDSQKHLIKEEITRLEEEVKSLELSKHNWKEITKVCLFLVIVLNIIAAFVEVPFPIGFIPIPAVAYSLNKHTNICSKIFEEKREIVKLHGIIFDIDSSKQT